MRVFDLGIYFFFIVECVYVWDFLGGLVMNRKFNRKIIALLAEAVEKYPNMRFTQLLCSLDVTAQNNSVGLAFGTLKDEFYLQSSDLYNRVNMAWEKIRGGA